MKVGEIYVCEGETDRILGKTCPKKCIIQLLDRRLKKGLWWVYRFIYCTPCAVKEKYLRKPTFEELLEI